MEKRFLQWIGFGFLVVALLAICLGLMTVIANTFTPEKKGDLATWVGAFFAAAAFCGTIYLATKESRDSSKEKSDTAIVLAAGMIERIGETRRAVKAVDSSIEAAIHDIAAHPDPHEFAQANLRPFARKVYNALLECPDFSVDELKGIVILPNQCAAHLAATAQRIRVIREDARRISEGMAAADLMATTYLHASRGNLATCKVSLGVAEKECRLAIADLNADLLSRGAGEVDVD